MYISHHQDKVLKYPSGFSQNILPAVHLLSLACSAFYSKNNLAFFHQILSVGHLISVSYLVYQFIGIEKDSNSNTQ